MLLTDLSTSLDVKIYSVEVVDLSDAIGEILVYLEEEWMTGCIKYSMYPKAYMILTGDAVPTKYDLVPFLEGLDGDVTCHIHDHYTRRVERWGRV